MRVLKTKSNSSELSSTIDFSDELEGLSKSDKKSALNDIGEFLVEQVLVNAAESKSIVSGEEIPALTSKEYKLKKKDEAGNTRANLELSGEMLDSVDFSTSQDSLSLGVYGEAAPRADGHNNFSGKSKLPKRRIFPSKDQTFKKNVEKEIARIISDYKSDAELISKEDFKNVDSKASFYSLLKNRLGFESASEARLAVFRSKKLLDLIEDADLEEYL